MNANLIVIGTPVIYWSVIDDQGNRSNPTKTEITSEVWKLGSGELVCKVKGIAGGVSIDHLDSITPGSLLAAKLQGCKDVSDQDFIQESEKFFADRGVTAVFEQTQPQALTIAQALANGYTEAIEDGGDYPELLDEIDADKLNTLTYWLVEKDGFSFQVSSSKIKELIVDSIRNQDQVYDEEDLLGQSIETMPDFLFEQFSEALNRAMEPHKWRGATNIRLLP